MTQTHTELPTAGDKVDYHRDQAMAYGDRADLALDRLRAASAGSRDNVLNQVIGVNLKLADVHARLALAVARSTGLDA